MDESDRVPDKEFPWVSGEAYERYVGRWSYLVAQKFLAWLSLPPGLRWLDIGCGAGALSRAILLHASPAEVMGIDRSEEYVAFTRQKFQDERARFEVGDAQALSIETGGYDAAVSGLVLNFIPRPDLAVKEMARVVKAGGAVAVYVWDYAEKMQMMRYFWDAASSLDPAALELDEGRQFSICKPDALAGLFQKAGLLEVETIPLVIKTDFKDFNDFWSPFLGGQGPAAGYAMSLSEEKRAALRERLRDSLPTTPDGSIPLVARAWAVRGVSAG
jgi:SAM-dependent methyltransferase